MRLLRRPTLRITWEFVPQDLWVGIFWDIDQVTVDLPQPDPTGWVTLSIPGKIFHLYVCVLPMLPLHLEWLLFPPKEKR